MNKEQIILIIIAIIVTLFAFAFLLDNTNKACQNQINATIGCQINNNF